MTLDQIKRGVWRNGDDTNNASYWSRAAYVVGGPHGIEDLVCAAAQAWDEGGVTVEYCHVMFPGVDSDTRYHTAYDMIKPLLDEALIDGRQVLLNIQPMHTDVTDLIHEVLNHYSDYPNIVGVVVDVEWVYSEPKEHVSSTQRDAWKAAVKSHLPNGKFFLITYYWDVLSYLPPDDGETIILFDGLGGTQEVILTGYHQVMLNYTWGGLYTGYKNNIPRTATPSQILAAAPNTRYIISAAYDAGQDPIPLDWDDNLTPVAYFHAIPTRGTVPISVMFQDLSDGIPTSWLWDFGDGSTSTEQNPIKKYTSPGTYTVTLTATNTNGSDTVTITEYIHVVIDIDYPLSVDFEASLFSADFSQNTITEEHDQ